jgi:hypothetical protein
MTKVPYLLKLQRTTEDSRSHVGELDSIFLQLTCTIEAVIATIWHPKDDVDSYHVVSILHDGNQLDSEIIYGYGNQYMETAKNMVNNFCMMNDDEIIENLDFSDVHVVKVKRKRDLFQKHKVIPFFGFSMKILPLKSEDNQGIKRYIYTVYDSEINDVVFQGSMSACQSYIDYCNDESSNERLSAFKSAKDPLIN